MKSKLAVWAWALYDLANTIFFINVITLYFALWVTVDMGGKDIYYSIAMTCSMFLIALFQPVLGALSDRRAKRKPFLIGFTLMCVVFTGLLGLTKSLWAGLFFFALANIGYQTGIVFYDMLLPEISLKEELGKVSGLGVALGYAGTFIGLLLVRPFVLQAGRQAAFVPTALFFLIFALPCFIFVKDVGHSPASTAGRRSGDHGPQSTVHSKQKTDLISIVRNLKDTFINRRKYPGLFRFMIAQFLYLNAINTTMMFVSVYGNKVMGFTDTELNSFFLFATAFASAGSAISGFLTDKIGAKKTLMGTITLWCLTFVLVAFAFNKWMFWIIGPLSGITLGSTWVASRAFIARIAPVEKRGEFFGFFGLSGRAAMIGPVVWGAVALLLEPLGLLRYRIAVVSLLAFCVAGLVLLRKVPEPGVQTGG